MTVCRLAKPPNPSGMVPVSPQTTVIASGATPSWSAVIWASAVLSPCPIGMAPV